MATEVIEEPRTRDSLLDVRHRITVEEYHQMIEAGVFGPEPRVELLEGVIVRRTKNSRSHDMACDLIPPVLRNLLATSQFFVSRRSPMTISDRDGEPEPDVSVLRGRPRDYASRQRTPADAAWLVEVSDTSYDYDRYQKWVTYAAARVPVYWILDLNRRRLEVHTEPIGDGEAASYARTQFYGPDDEVPLVLDGREAARFLVREILP
jgi:Uma2 family endonuclease